ncbi:MAG: TetR family transcriptional regulator [Thermosynechococcaceae cyanobacterium]
MTESTSTPSGMRRKPLQARSQERVKRILDVAEALFIAEGYTATTTNAIATRAQVPIGSLYQFFPDKAAILQALALRYNEQLHQRLIELNRGDGLSQPLSVYVHAIIDTAHQFFTDHPGYTAIYIEMQGTMPELQEIDAAADAQLIQDFAADLFQRNPGLEPMDYEAIAFVLVKAIGTLLWLSLSQAPLFRQRLVAETKRFALHYLQSYFPADPRPANHSAGADGLESVP